jgi:hypothetical protein
MATPTARAWVRCSVHSQPFLRRRADSLSYLFHIGIGWDPHHFRHTGWPVFVRVRVFVGVRPCGVMRGYCGVCRGRILRGYRTGLGFSG